MLRESKNLGFRRRQRRLRLRLQGEGSRHEALVEHENSQQFEMIATALSSRLCACMTTRRYGLNRSSGNIMRQSHRSAKITTPVYSQTSITKIRREYFRLAGNFDVEAERRSHLLRRSLDVEVIARISNDVNASGRGTDAMFALQLFSHHTVSLRIPVHHTLARSGLEVSTYG